MIFKKNKHNSDLYNTLLTLSRNIFFYRNIKLHDTFETRIYLMFIHFSLILIIFKKKNEEFEQKLYDSLFNNIENNLRELGFGDIAVNKKMKNLNKIFYDLLIKLEKNSLNGFALNREIILSYFTELQVKENDKYRLFNEYFVNFYNFCFELPLKNMVRECQNFK
jgi:cytochrome b pre-mRNA-processing protein 3|tara:strand:- start:1048 stop:1542 length:495 start_codon:yes stop_codon:yes gene_type:complete